MSFVVKPYESVELGQTRVFEGCNWETWSTLPPHERFAKNQPNRVLYAIAAEAIGFVIKPMDEDGYFTMLLEDATVTTIPIDVILTHSRLV